MSTASATAKSYFNTYFWNTTQHHGRGVINKALEVCTQQKFTSCLLNGVICLGPVAAAEITSVIINKIFHSIVDWGVDSFLPEKMNKTAKKVCYFIIRLNALIVSAAISYKAAEWLTPKLNLFSSEDVLKFSLLPIFSSVVFFFMPVTQTGLVIAGVTAVLPCAAAAGWLKNHSLYVIGFSSALHGSGLREYFL